MGDVLWEILRYQYGVPEHPLTDLFLGKLKSGERLIEVWDPKLRDSAFVSNPRARNHSQLRIASEAPHGAFHWGATRW